MLATKKPRPYTDKQKQAAANSVKRRQHIEKVRTIRLRGRIRNGKKVGLASELNKYLIAYGARLIEIDHKYPFGDPERWQWLIAHRRNGVKRLRQILQGNLNVV